MVRDAAYITSSVPVMPSGVFGVTTEVVGITIGLVGVVVAVVTLRASKRRDIVAADREVLDIMWTHLTDYYRRLELAQSLAASQRPDMRRMASDISDAWLALKTGSTQIGRLSRLRYDGLRILASRIQEACRTTSASRRSLEPVANGTAVTAPSTLLDAVPWPSLDTDALLCMALSAIYRREGPLTPKKLAWWRLPSRRENTSMQIAAPIRHHVKRSGKDKGDKSEELVTSIDQVKELVRDHPDLSDLTPAEINDLAYRVLYSEE